MYILMSSTMSVAAVSRHYGVSGRKLGTKSGEALRPVVHREPNVLCKSPWALARKDGRNLVCVCVCARARACVCVLDTTNYMLCFNVLFDSHCHRCFFPSSGIMRNHITTVTRGVKRHITVVTRWRIWLRHCVASRWGHGRGFDLTSNRNDYQG
jgi:hypothetical protein